MGASISDQMHLTAAAAKERQILSEDADRFGPFRLEVPRLKNRQPELSEKSARQRAGSGVDEVIDICFQRARHGNSIQVSLLASGCRSYRMLIYAERCLLSLPIRSRCNQPRRALAQSRRVNP